MEMSGGEVITIERAFDIDALSKFNCGVREIDQLIHKRTGGLLSFITEVPCEFYLVKRKMPAKQNTLFLQLRRSSINVTMLLVFTRNADL